MLSDAMSTAAFKKRKFGMSCWRLWHEATSFADISGRGATCAGRGVGLWSTTIEKGTPGRLSLPRIRGHRHCLP